MLYVKNFKKICLQEKSLLYYYLEWAEILDYNKCSWFGRLHESEEDQLPLGPTCLAEWS